MKVSIICACKNRYETLSVSLQSWVKYPEVYEIIIVDWSSDESLEHLKERDPRIKIINVRGEKYFNTRQPLNLAGSFATGDRILKLDCDYIFNPYSEFNFFENFNVDDNSFFCGQIDSMEPIAGSHFVKYLRGVLYLTKDNFMKVGGYNEKYTLYYGNDDGEIEGRLQFLGLEKKVFSLNNCYCMIHIPHTDKARIENFEGHIVDRGLEEYTRNQLSQSTGYTGGQEFDWQVEYLLTQKHIWINSEKPIDDNYTFDMNTKWKVSKTRKKQVYEAVKIN